jgi:hypothetical protein
MSINSYILTLVNGKLLFSSCIYCQYRESKEFPVSVNLFLMSFYAG